MPKEQNKCSDCHFFYADDRITAYRRETCYFCKRKGAFFSRNYKVGEGTRIGLHDDACENFINKRNEESHNGL